eukprot:TRINITY_DN136157_c0_g1_i3.p1 TRINITY_DN136157_c0_g1~~TRINITY_DN136157_c0_g1_i3.p1  ORF type:complete len:116 (-),score=5.31 TRINITY_DN136157_c0_g1_i3:10-357(-)
MRPPIIPKNEEEIVSLPAVSQHFYQIRDFKLLVELRPIGNAPILKQSVFRVNGNETFSELAEQIKPWLKKDSIHLYLSNQFEPTPDDSLGDIFKCYKRNSSDTLQIGYSMTPAFL